MEEEIKKQPNKKKVILISVISTILILLIVAASIFGYIVSVYGSAFFSAEWMKEAKDKDYAKENAKCEKGQIVLFGDSISEMYDEEKYFKEYTVYNRAISGDRTDHMLERIESNALVLEPKTMFFLGGANDLRDKKDPKEIAQNIYDILSKTQTTLPNCKIVVQSVYPVNTTKTFMGRNLIKQMTNEAVVELNGYIKTICEKLNITYIDTHSKLLDENNELKSELTIDGLHVNDKAYDIITDLLKPQIA